MELVCKTGVMGMYGLNVFSLLVFAAINIFSAMLVKCGSETRSRVLRIISAGLLAFNLCRYALALLLGRGFIFPVEFSSVAYFAVPAILLTRAKRAQSWAAYSGIMAGFFYYMTLILSGGRVYADYLPNDIYISLYCHGSLYLCGLVSLKTNRFGRSDRFLLLFGNVCVAVNAWLLRPIAEGKARIFIYELMDGLYVKQLFPEYSSGYLMPVYYLLMLGFLLLSVKLFFQLNNMQYEKHLRAVKETGRVPAAVKTLT
jgi:hypothetical protein